MSEVLVFETLWQNSADGWSTASRAYARAMASAGVDVRLKSWARDVELDEAVAREIPPKMREPVSDWDYHVFSCPLGSPEKHREVGTFELFHKLNKPPRFFYTMFERRRVQPEIITELNRLEGVWVPCSMNHRVLVEAGCRTSAWIPYPYFDDDPYLSLPPPRREPRTFLWIGRWEPRKAPHNLIRAFFRAFKPGEARLILKIGPSPWVRSSYLGPYDVIGVNLGRGWTRAAAAKDIEVVEGRLTLEEMRALHARSDVYVSASRGEGIDLPAFAAKLAGRRVVTTASGGPEDFLDEDDIVVPSTQDLAAPEYEWIWGPGALYTDYDIETLACAMESVMRPMKRGVLWPRVPERHRASLVGKMLATWLEEQALLVRRA